MSRTVHVNEAYQTGYTYTATEPAGRNFNPEFAPGLTPQQMLRAGVFGGNYFTVPPAEFPTVWFKGVKLSTSGHAEAALNYFKVNASQPLAEWKRKGWIHPEDPQGWFLWYCRYYQGRRISEEDIRQIKRWRNMRRHVTQLRKACPRGALSCHPRQRQALLHWAYDSRQL